MTDPTITDSSPSGLELKILTSFRIEKNLHQKMKRVAKEEGMTMQGFISKAVLNYIDNVIQSR